CSLSKAEPPGQYAQPFLSSPPPPGERGRDEEHRPRPVSHTQVELLEFDLGASLLELGLDLVGFFLRSAFLDGLRRAFDEILRFLKAKAGDRADFLDHLDLLVASGGKDDREFGLGFSGRSGSAAGGNSGDRDRSRSRNAPL